MLSFWEQQSFLNYDAIVIGGGIVGLSAACSLCEHKPGMNVLVIERGMFPTGASTKNAGFACFGSAAEIWSDIQILGEEKALELVNWRMQGLGKLRNRLGDVNIGYLEYGGGEFVLKNEPFDETIIDKLNPLLKDMFGKEPFSINNKKINEFGFAKDGVKIFIENHVEGQIDTGLMMKNLMKYAALLGITILSGCEVKSFADNKQTVAVEIVHSLLNESVKFKADKLAICTNAFTKQFFSELDVVPGRGQILATKPIPGMPFKGIFHFEEGYYYFRNHGERIIFGGGRNIDFEGEATPTFELNNVIQDKLDYYLQTLIIPGRSYEVETRWAGIMAFGKEKLPIIKQVSENVVLGCRMNGMGIAIGSLVGERLAGMMR
ncbi:MAG: FAD-binding oxidoreductase [Flavobacteriaceae bacterium]|nr:FAD-binding oxidoreductase [Flavobacteriaceae bacterium]